jgi:AcrR family transcriptional regulator
MNAEKIEQTPRAAARRKQVLDAASICFRRYGFHAASMAQVAAEADMSVGHIYRYFTGKEQIIAAIVRQDADRILAMLADIQNHPGDLRTILIERADQAVIDATDPDRAALMIEIRAEASRNPGIRAIVRALDLEIEQQTRVLIRTATGRELEEADLAARVEMLAGITRGIAMGTVINPYADQIALTRLVRLVVDVIVS